MIYKNMKKKLKYSDNTIFIDSCGKYKKTYSDKNKKIHTKNCLKIFFYEHEHNYCDSIICDFCYFRQINCCSVNSNSDNEDDNIILT